MKLKSMRILSAAVTAAVLSSGGAVRAALLGYWNFDGPPAATATDRLRDLSGNNYHGNDRNAASGTSRVLFNNNDVPRAPFFSPPGNDNYSLDLSGADRYVIMEGAVGIAAPGAVDSRGNAFNIGNSSSLNQPITSGRLTVSFWYKGLPSNAWGNYVAKGGEGYATPGIPSGTWEGWAVRRLDVTSRLAWTTRNFGLLAGNGDGDVGLDIAARSGGTMPAPSSYNVTTRVNSTPPAGIFSDNLAGGMWQHIACVWDGTWKHWYVNGYQVRSERITTGVNVGTMSRLVFGADENPNTLAISSPNVRYSRTRMDEIAIFDEALNPAQIEDLARGADPRRPLRASVLPFDFAFPPASPAVQAYLAAYPTGQNAAAAIDGSAATKYTNVAGRFSGLIVTPAAVSTVQSFIITTADNLLGRDPSSYELYGTNVTPLASGDTSGGRAEAWTLISSGALSLPAARQTAGTPVTVTNSTSYTSYKILFPTLVSEAVMQIGGIQLYSTTNGTGAGIFAAANVSRAVTEPSVPNGHSQSPGAEVVDNLLDGVSSSKYLNNAGATSGFIVTPGASVVQSFKLTTANDAAPRDPSSYALYGTNNPIASAMHSDGKAENWTLIASGRLNLPLARVTAGPVVPVTNATSYTSYKLSFPTNSGGPLFQLADAQFYSSTDGTGAGLLAPGQPILAIADFYMGPNSAGSQAAGYVAGGAIIPQGGPGTVGIFEMRPNSVLRRQDGNTTATASVYSLDSPILFARFGTGNAPTPTGTFGIPPFPYARANSIRIDYGDPQSGANSGFNASHTDFLTNSTADDNQFFQMVQGCFRVPAAGVYTFTMRGDDGAQLAIDGATWTKMYVDNGVGSFVATHLQNAVPTGDTNNIAVANFPAAGDYNFRYQWSEQAGGAWNEVFYAQGDRGGYDAAVFKNLGDPAGGLTLVDHKPMMELRSSAIFVVGGVPAAITLSWDAAFATAVTLNGGPFTNLDVTSSTVNGYGSTTIASPAATTTYTVTGVRGAGTPVAANVTVYVDAPPTLNTFTIDDSTLVAGAPMTLRWTGGGGGTFNLFDGTNNTNVSANTTIFGNGAFSGAITLPAPAVSTTYTLTASNAGGSADAQTSVTIGTPPSITTFTASDTFVEPDSQVIFNYVTSNATTVTFSPNVSGTPTPPPSGEVCERVTSASTYTLTASNAFGLVSSSVSIDVIQPLGVTAAVWSLTLYKSNGTLINNLTDAQNLINGAIARGNVTVGGVSTPTPITINNQPYVNLQDGAGDGAIGGGTWPTGNWGPAAIEDFVVRATASLVVNVSGEHTLNINNDDGGRLRIDLNNNGSFTDAGETVINNDVLAGPHTVTVEIFVSQGIYPIEYVYFERGGGAEGEVFYTNDGGNNILLQNVPPAPPITFPELRITEFMAANNFTLRDGQGDFEDWIEIYNGTGAPVSLAGYFLTDDPALPGKWAFPAGSPHVLFDGEYFVVFASSKNITLPGDEYHTNFKLDPDGDYLALTKSDGMGGYITVHEFAATYPEQNNDISYGFYDTEHYTGYFASPTPGGRNGGGYDGYVKGETALHGTQGGNPVSFERGFFTAPVTVTITADDPLATIRYTTNGGIPSATKGTDYTGPFVISSTTALRTAAVRKGYITSDIDTHTLIFVDDVITQNAAHAISKGFPAGTVNTQVFDYGMAGTVVTGNEAAVKAALQAIPTISIVIDSVDLVQPQRGIYVNPSGRGRSFERLASMELLNDDGSGGGQFQIDCGLRIRGGFSRDGNNPKHAWHFYYRPEYDGDLRYPMFGTEGAADFEQLDLQCPQNYSWSYSPQNNTYSYTAPGGVATTRRLRYNTFVREPVSRDLFGLMGQPYPRTRHYHCYVNGVYWGLYMSQERAEASFGETYIGGDKNNYDVLKSAGNAAGYNTEATDGTFDQGTSGAPGSAWAKLWYRTNEMRTTAGMTEATRRTMYFELMGLQPDGTPWNDPVNHPVLLDADNLIDYMLITWYCGSFDAPLSTFLNSASNNWFSLRDQQGITGFQSFPHDFEHGMGTDLQTGAPLRSTDRIGPWGGNGANYKGQGMYNQLATYIKSNPEYFHENLASCIEYRMLFWDRAYRHLTRTGGALTQPVVMATIDARAATVRTAIIAESARWGDAKGVAAVDYLPSGWEESITQLKDWVAQGSNAEYLASIPTQANPTGTQGLGRAGRLKAQLRGYLDKVVLSDATNTALPLYSSLEAPDFSSLGGVVTSGTTVTITNPNGAGTLYWSTNGTDPRDIGGAISSSPSVQTGASPATVTLTATGTLVARVYNSATSTWSAINFGDFVVGTPASAANLRITEINYNPKDATPGTPTAGDIQTFEFVELVNYSAGPIDLSGVEFTNGISYTFPTGRVLAAGERIVVAKDMTAFVSRYPDAGYPGLSGKTVGPFAGQLDNSGERLVITGLSGAVIQDFTYSDSPPWPVSPDGNNGTGATLVFSSACTGLDSASDPLNWFGHQTVRGNPGGPDIPGYTAWATANGASGNGSGDSDGDGIADLIEYLMGSSTTASSTAQLPFSGVADFTVGMTTAKYQTITFTREIATSDLEVAVEVSDDLAAANWTPTAVFVSRTDNGDGSETYVYRAPLPVSQDNRVFMRVHVTCAPVP